jgi:16S rRNA (cytidine1402-2'-O)-methyltransferase
MAEVWGAERRICLARELTKKFEEFARGTIKECLEHLAQHAPLGEYCLIAEGGQAAGSPANGAWWETLTLAEHVERYVQQGQDKKEATKQVAADRGVPKREVYNALLEKE